MKSLFISVFILLYHGVSGADEVSVSVMEGDPVTLHTNVTTNQQEEISWFFNDRRIAKITGDQSKICTDVQCKERFRDRLKLDDKTGSLTITNTKTTDSGLYKLTIISSNSDGEKIFNVTVHGVSAAELDKVKRKPIKERESVTLDPGDPSVDNGSGLSSAAVAGIVVVVVVLLLVAAVAVIYYRKHQERRKNTKMQHNNKQNGSSSNSNEPLMQITTNETSPNPAKETSA